MKPVQQTRFGKSGNCIQACVASILERPLEAIPDFLSAKTNPWLACQSWLDSQGYYLIGASNCWMCAGIEFIAGGMGPRGIGHCVVMRDGKVIHDPHPDGRGILFVDLYLFIVRKERER